MIPWVVLPAAAGTLQGQVVDEDGAPVSGAEVSAWGPPGTVGPTLTDSSGSFSLEVEDGVWRTFVSPPDGSGLLAAWNAEDAEPCASAGILVEGETRLDAPRLLARGVTVSGRVVGPDGAPVAGLEVVPETDLLQNDLPRGETDADGRFTLTGLPGDQGVALEVGRSGEVPYQWLGGDYEGGPYYRFVDGDDLGDLQIRAGVRLSGRVDGPGGPVTEGSLYAYSAGQAVGVTISADGTWSAAGLPPGNALVWADVPGLATTYYPSAGAPESYVDANTEGAAYTLDLQMPAEATLTVALQGDGDVSGISGTLYNEDYTVAHVRASDEAGTLMFDGLWPGNWVLSTRGGGFVGELYGGDVAPTRIAVDGATTLTVALRPGAELRGRIVDETGAAVPGATALLVTDSAVGATADEDGAWTMEGLVSGWADLEVYQNGLCDGDPTWTLGWWRDARTSELAEELRLEEGVETDLGDMVIHNDADADQMGDAWETANGLDPTRDDADEDPDADGYVNVREWQLDTDPTSVREAACGCGAPTSVSLLPLMLALPLLRRRVGISGRRAPPGPRGPARPAPGTGPGTG